MWFWLGIAIASEVTATLALRASEGFTKLLPSAVVVVGYAVAFFALSRSLVHGMEIGLAYAIWAGIGVVIVAVVSVPLFGERLSLLQLAGVGLVVVGVVALELGAAH